MRSQTDSIRVACTVGYIGRQPVQALASCEKHCGRHIRGRCSVPTRERYHRMSAHAIARNKKDNWNCPAFTLAYTWHTPAPDNLAELVAIAPQKRSVSDANGNRTSAMDTPARALLQIHTTLKAHLDRRASIQAHYSHAKTCTQSKRIAAYHIGQCRLMHHGCPAPLPHQPRPSLV